MLKLALHDLTREGLAKIAKLYSVGIDKKKDDEVRNLIQDKMSSTAEIAFRDAAPSSPVAPDAPSPSFAPWWKTSSVVVSIIALLITATITGFAMNATWRNAATAADNLRQTIEKEEARKQKEMIVEWQKMVVFYVIDEGVTEGVPFSEIETKYLQAAAKVKEVDLKKEHLQSDSLKKILMQLQCEALIYTSLDGKYVSGRVLVPTRPDKANTEEKVNFAVLTILSQRPGQLTMAELAPLITDGQKISHAEFVVIMNHLISSYAISIDEDSRLWSATHPAPRRKKRP